MDILFSSSSDEDEINKQFSLPFTPYFETLSNLGVGFLSGRKRLLTMGYVIGRETSCAMILSTQLAFLEPVTRTMFFHLLSQACHKSSTLLDGHEIHLCRRFRALVGLLYELGVRYGRRKKQDEPPESARIVQSVFASLSCLLLRLISQSSSSSP